MKVLFFIEKANGFFISMIDFMESFFPEYEKEYIVIDRRNEFDFKKLKNTTQITEYSQFWLDKKVREKFFVAEKIIVSGVFVSPFALLAFPKKVLQKCIYQFWGGDYTCFREETIKNSFIKILTERCVNNAKAIVNLTEGEKKEFTRYFTVAKRFFFVPVPAGPEHREINKKYRIKAKTAVFNRKRIIIGNSATESNNHLEIFDRLANKEWAGYEIVCPLSYGSKVYADRVIEKGKKIFGDSFFPITEFMPFVDYLELLLSCSVGIYDHNRQQGLGNAYLILNMGKKLYLRRNSESWVYHSSFGAVLNDSADLAKQSIEEIFRWDNQKTQANYVAIDREEMNMLSVWNDILVL